MKKQSAFLIGGLTSILLLAGTMAQAASEDGNWIWKTPGRNGNAPRESVLSLKSDGSTLTGKLSTPGHDGKPTDTPITNGKIDGDNFSFDIVREFNGNSVTISYSGAVANGEITGQIVTKRDGQTQSHNWLAKNAGDQTEATPVAAPKPGYDENGHKIVNTTHYKEISVADAVQFLADHPDAIIIDARSPEEYAAGHIPNAKNYNLTDDAKYKAVLETITDKSKWYIVHSAVGHYRTVRALEYFEANGFEHAVAIDGGFAAWKKAGEPIAKD